jgi:hypothetical protein
VRGSQLPRIWTPPLRDLDDPASTYGYELIDFAAEIGWPFDPWQQWVAIHLGELLPDGRPRFRTALVIVARQNGKTVFARVLTLYWMFVEQVPLIIGTSTDRRAAKTSWASVINMATSVDLLKAELPATYRYDSTGTEDFWNIHGSHYMFAAPNRRAGRSYTVHRAILDELREHDTHAAYDAVMNAMNAVPDAQAVAVTNQGDASAVVLDSLRDSAIEYIETGIGDPRLFLAEWSAPAGCDPTDLQAMAMANPDLGNRIQPDALMGTAIRAKRAGGEELTGFKTEILCQRVMLLDPAIDPDRWEAGGTDTPLDLAQHRDKVALAYDVALDGSHASLIAAAVIDGKVHIEVVKAWSGYGCTKALRTDLPAIVAQVKPRALGWFPNGPSAAVAADLADRKVRGWPPRRVVIEEIKSEVTQVCMGLAEQVATDAIVHPKDPMLDAHVESATPLWRGDAWVFARRGAGPIDGVYALAGAVHLARTLPPPPPPLVAL